MRLRLLFPLALSIVAVAAVVGACGDDDDEDGGDGNGGGELSVEQYLREVDEIQDDVTEATDAIGEQSEQAFADPPTARQALTSAVDVGEAAIARLNDLDPSVGAEPQHERLVKAAEDLVAAVQTYLDRLQGVEAGPEFEEVKEDAEADDSDLSVAIDSMIAACEDMQLFIDDAQQDFELSCPAAP